MDSRHPNQVEQILKAQIDQLSSPCNRELQSYWNWHPHKYHSNVKTNTTSSSSSSSSPLPSFHTSARNIVLDTGVEIEVIVADFHDVFINACLKCFSELQLPVTMKQGPMQSVLLDVVQEHRNGTPTDEESATQTFILFGGYGNGMINSGLQKQLHDVFPDQMDNLREQAMDSMDDDEYAINMINQGDAFIAQPSIIITENSGCELHLVSCCAYPRKQHPSEHEHIQYTFQKGLELVYSQYRTNPSPQITTARKLRIVTHAMGSFVGHDDPSVFAWGLAHGLHKFLQDHQ
jgi:hypothetical protein